MKKRGILSSAAGKFLIGFFFAFLALGTLSMEAQVLTSVNTSTSNNYVSQQDAINKLSIELKQWANSGQTLDLKTSVQEATASMDGAFQLVVLEALNDGATVQQAIENSYTSLNNKFNSAGFDQAVNGKLQNALSATIELLKI